MKLDSHQMREEGNDVYASEPVTLTPRASTAPNFRKRPVGGLSTRVAGAGVLGCGSSGSRLLSFSLCGAAAPFNADLIPPLSPFIFQAAVVAAEPARLAL